MPNPPLSAQVLTSIGVKPERATLFLPDLNALLPQHGIDTPLRIAHFLAQVAHESGLLRILEENLNYSAERLRAVFGKYFTAAQAKAYAGRKEAIGNRVYADRLGNGDEASGDGYRYRGRGLMQTTGKANYRALGDWLHVDVVSDPDLVKSTYAVHAAVFFWTNRKINALADADDVRAVTKRVNGGLNGLADRLELLRKAKAALGIGAQATLDGATHQVRATQLNLRSKPIVTPATLIASLPQGLPVVVVGASDEPDWVRVRVVLQGQLAEGFVKSEHLTALPPRARGAEAAPRAVTAPPPPVHLKEGRPDITRRGESGRAFPLGEPGMPRRTATTSDGKAKQLLGIVAYLDSEKKAHARYGPTSTATYCNIYAYDYCYLAGAYLPRVFWTRTALQRLAAGEQVPVRYDDTVRELNANSLHDWLLDYGVDFGWERVLNLDVLQAAANGGAACLIVAKRRDLNRSGHIVAVVPESPGHAAARDGAGEVLRPVESQAGAKNYRLIVKPTAWWREAQFQAFAFWRHA